jgi:hypothetical protein
VKVWAARQVYDDVQRQGVQVDMLINNAGFGTYGLFDETSGERQHAEVMVNVTAVVDLTYLFLQPMLQRGDGAIINVASTAGFQPLPRMAVYGATKAFVLSFSEALWAEGRRRGVRVMALCPGPVETPFFDAVGSEEPAVGVMRTPEEVVNTALWGIERNKSHVIPGWQTFLLAQSSRVMPRSWVVLVAEQMFTPRTDKKPAAAPQG